MLLSTTSAIPTPDAKPKGSRFWRITKRALKVIVVLIVVVLSSGAIYQLLMDGKDSRRFPQEGRSVPLGAQFPGVSLNLDCTGQGSPTVILDTGLGVPAMGWRYVQQDVAKFTRVCSYDRAGYGWSTPGPMPRTSAEIVKELKALLVASGEKGPYVMVAHSFGGFDVRVYTKDYPDDVAGLVLVDTSHEDQVSRLPLSLQAFQAQQIKQMGMLSKLARLMTFFGVSRLTARKDPSLTGAKKDFQDEAGYLSRQPKYIDATFSEIANFSESADEVRVAGNLGDRPLVVLTAGKTVPMESLPKGITRKDMEDFHELWVKDLQVREAHLSTRGKQIIVPDSTHMIPMERPDTVVAAIREVCEAVKNSAAGSNGAAN